MPTNKPHALQHYYPGDQVVVRRDWINPPPGRLREGMVGTVVDTLAPTLKKRGSKVTSAYYRVYFPELDREYSVKGHFIKPDHSFEGKGTRFRPRFGGSVTEEGRIRILKRRLSDISREKKDALSKDRIPLESTYERMEKAIKDELRDYGVEFKE